MRGEAVDREILGHSENNSHALAYVPKGKELVLSKPSKRRDMSGVMKRPSAAEGGQLHAVIKHSHDEALGDVIGHAVAPKGVEKRTRLTSKSLDAAALPQKRVRLQRKTSSGGCLWSSASPTGASAQSGASACGSSSVRDTDTSPRDGRAVYRPAIRVHSKATANSYSQGSPSSACDEPTLLRELRQQSVKVLRAELLRLRPGMDLNGIVEKEELCRLLLEARGSESHSAQPQKTALPSELQRSKISGVDLAPGLPIQSMAPHADVQLKELRTWSVSALKDMLRKIRPDVDLRNIVEKEELCRMLAPWL